MLGAPTVFPEIAGFYQCEGGWVLLKIHGGAYHLFSPHLDVANCSAWET